MVILSDFIFSLPYIFKLASVNLPLEVPRRRGNAASFLSFYHSCSTGFGMIEMVNRPQCSRVGQVKASSFSLHSYYHIVENSNFSRLLSNVASSILTSEFIPRAVK